MSDEMVTGLAFVSVGVCMIITGFRLVRESPRPPLQVIREQPGMTAACCVLVLAVGLMAVSTVIGSIDPGNEIFSWLPRF